MNKQPQNNSDTKWMGAGLFAAFVASLCCITPVVAFLAGISGAASMFTWIEPFRPYLIGLTALLLGFAWYQKLRPRWDPECACEEDPSFWQSSGFLGIVTVLTVLLLAFPYYSDAFFPSQNQNNVVYVQESRVRTITLDIEGMTCTGCEATVTNAAGSVDGVLEAEASYDTGQATVTYDRSKTDRATIEAAINKTGFTVADSQEGKQSSANMQSVLNSKDFCPLRGEGEGSGSGPARRTCTIEYLDQTLSETLDKDVSVNVVKRGGEIAHQLTGKEGIAWDIYMFFDGKVTWGDNFPGPTEYIHQLNPEYYSWVEKNKYFSGIKLKQQLADLSSKYKTTVQ